MRGTEEGRHRGEEERDKVMGRLEWFRDLKAVFSLLQAKTPDLVTVPRQELTKHVANTKFDLQVAEVYYSKERSVAFSLSEVLHALSSIQETQVSWDQVIDAIFQIGVNRAKSQAREKTTPVTTLTASQSVVEFSSKPVTSQLHTLTVPVKCPPSTSANTVDVSFPEDKLTSVPEVIANSKHMTLLVRVR